MKGFLACVLASVPLFQSRTLKEPIHIILSYDEEVGCTGVRPLIARLGNDLPRPRAVIVGEPTSMAVIDAHKRIDAYRTIVTGKRGAFEPAAARGECHLHRRGADRASSTASARELSAEESDERFDPPYLDRAGRHDRGRHSHEHRAEDLRVSMAGAQPAERRAPDGAARARRLRRNRLLPRMRPVAPAASIETSHKGGVPAFLAKPGSEAVALALALTGANTPARCPMQPRPDCSSRPAARR